MKTLLALFLVACFGVPTIEEPVYDIPELPKYAVEAQIKPKIAHTHVYKPRVAISRIPPPAIAEIAKRVSTETGFSQTTIERIMYAESKYRNVVSPQNKNGTYDNGIFQINDIHISEATRLGLDLKNPEDNATFAIVLMKRNGLRDWNASKINWQ